MQKLFDIAQKETNIVVCLFGWLVCCCFISLAVGIEEGRVKGQALFFGCKFVKNGIPGAGGLFSGPRALAHDDDDDKASLSQTLIV